MKILGLDTETTGLKPDSGDRIIELCAIQIDLTMNKMTAAYEQRFHPEGQRMDPKAEAVHGISMSELTGCPTFQDQLPLIQPLLDSSDIVVAHNLDFDVPFLFTELERTGGRFPPGLRGFCTMENGRWACPDGKNPKLSELAWSLGIDYDPSKAHAAKYDVQVMLKALLKGIKAGLFDLEKAV